MVLWTCILVQILWWEFDIPVASPSWNHLDLSPCPFCLLSLVFCEIIELRVVWLCWTGWKPQNHILLVTGSSAECWTIFIAFIQLASVVEKWLNTFPWTMIKMRDHKTGWVLKKNHDLGSPTNDVALFHFFGNKYYWELLEMLFSAPNIFWQGAKTWFFGL